MSLPYAGKALSDSSGGGGGNGLGEVSVNLTMTPAQEATKLITDTAKFEIKSFILGKIQSLFESHGPISMQCVVSPPGSVNRKFGDETYLVYANIEYPLSPERSADLQFEIPVYSDSSKTNFLPFFTPKNEDPLPPCIERISRTVREGWLPIFTALYRIAGWVHKIKSITPTLKQGEETYEYATRIESTKSGYITNTNKSIDIFSMCQKENIYFTINGTDTFQLNQVDQLISRIHTHLGVKPLLPPQKKTLGAQYHAQIQRLTALLERAELQRSGYPSVLI
jgi:hypothetical protein